MAPSTHKHYRVGWIQIECPFCTGNAGYHLGYSTSSNYFTCWRCGWHHPMQVFTTLFGKEKADSYLKNFKFKKHRIGNSKVSENATICKLPPCLPSLSVKARNYLRMRKFNPVKLEHLWGIVSALPYSKYSGRIVAPIHFQRSLVSFQTRDITGKSTLRYITCSKAEERIHHKYIVYGFDKVQTDSVVIVEGITDVWRLGYGSVATFGIEYTSSQVRLLGESFKNKFILFDTVDKQARRQGKKLAEELSIYDGNVEYVELKGKYSKVDPAELPESYANAIMNELK